MRLLQSTTSYQIVMMIAPNPAPFPVPSWLGRLGHRREAKQCMYSNAPQLCPVILATIAVNKARVVQMFAAIVVSMQIIVQGFACSCSVGLKREQLQ